MHKLWDIIIEPVLKAIRPGVIVEIGSDKGENTEKLLEFCKENKAILHAVDPVPKFDVKSFLNRYGKNFIFYESLSLNAIPKIGVSDVVLIDGDHNWYTVINELRLIERCHIESSKVFPLIMVHDIGWPYGRRDLYYNPENIPDKFRKPFKQKGMIPGFSELVEGGGLNQHLNNSIYENVLQSGVLTAVEDFIKETDQLIELIKIPGLSGLGILVPYQLKENNKALRALLGTFDIEPFIKDYIEKIERMRIDTNISLYNTEVLVSQRNKKIKLIKEERTKKIQELREEQQVEIQKLCEGQQVEIQKLREGQRNEINELRKKQTLQIEQLRKEIEKRDFWINKAIYSISELLNSKRWKMGAMIGELYRKAFFKSKVRTVADYIQDLIKQKPIKEDAGNQTIGQPPKKKLRDLISRPAIQFPIFPEEQLPEIPVTIIIPIFNAFEYVKKCIESVLLHTQPPHEILLINDGSSDQRIEPLLQGYVYNNPRVKLMTNMQNQGYTRTINIGCMSCSTDVVLLNSDTLVTSRWIDRLRESAYRKKEIGTVTPVSNNAGAFSVPELNRDNEIPPGYTLDSYAELISKVAIGHLPEVFTGSGFCMYIKRAVLDTIGVFDDINFPIGYGEENDFCLRAVKAGFKNVLDDGVYIYHRREASFGTEKEQLSEKARVQLRLLHPEYDSLLSEFQNMHPLFYFSESVKNALKIDKILGDDKDIEDFKQKGHISPTPKQDAILFIIHDGGGGSVFTTWDLAKSINEDFRCLVLACGSYQWHLYDLKSNHKEHTFNFDEEWNPIETTDPLRLSMFKFICREFGISIVHIRSLVGLSPELLSFLKYLDIKIVFSFHDLYTLCPTIHLINDKGVFCGGDCSLGKGVCLISNKWYSAIPELKNAYIHEWRKRMKDNLRFCDSFISTSYATREMIEKYYPGIKEKTFFVIEHGRDIKKTEIKYSQPEGKEIRVAVIGVAGAFKGANLLKKVIEQNTKHIRKRPQDIQFEFHIFGKVDRMLDLQTPGVVNHGPYERDMLQACLKVVEPSFAMIPSIVPESYCHTLTESWCYGIPVFGSDIGAIRERILKHGGGWLLDYRDPEKWFEKMLEIARNSEAYQEKINEISKMQFRTIKEMKEEYRKVYMDCLTLIR
ncbi:MAG: glycosyltransferase [Bacteroidales bacterium]|nr:glycosyltransferase [Bacteroidales bacterium]